MNAFKYQIKFGGIAMGKKKKRIIFGLGVAVLVGVVALAGCSTNTSGKVKNTVTQESQGIGLIGVENARQLGGYVNADGKMIKDGVLLRTGKLSSAIDADIKTLTEEYNLTEIIDLRATAEFKGDPDPAIEGVIVENIRVMNESNPAYLKAIAEVPTDDPVSDGIARVENGIIDDTMYSDIVTSTYAQEQHQIFFEKILEHEDGAVLWHCTGGKDRTGVAAVLLLSALDVDKETIMADFLLTNEYFADNIDYMVSETEKRTDDPEIIEGVFAEFGADAKYMEKMFTEIDEKYGSMDAFLKEAMGLTDEDRITLKDRYLV